MAGGEYCAIWLGPELPGDQRADDAISACFDSAPLDDAARHRRRAGGPAVALGRPATGDGRRPAMRRPARRRLDPHHLRRAQPVPPRQPRISRACRARRDDGDRCSSSTTSPTACRPATGCASPISSTYWPLVWPSPEAGDADACKAAPSTCRSAPPAQGDECGVRRARRRRALAASKRCARAPTAAWSSATTQTGMVTLAIVDDFGEVRDLDHGLVNGGIAREVWTHRSRRSAVGAWRDPLDADLVAKRMVGAHRNLHDDAVGRRKLPSHRPDRGLSKAIQLVFERDFEEKIPRDHI